MGSRLRLSALPQCTQTKHRRLFGGRWLWLAIILCCLVLGVLGNEDDEFEGEDEPVVPLHGITHEITESDLAYLHDSSAGEPTPGPAKFKHHPFYPIQSEDFWGLVFTALGLMIAAGGGIGGGGILVPIFILVMGFNPKYAIPLSNVTIFGGSIMNMVMNVRKRHPLADRPLVDWDLIMIMEPLTIGGALAGSFLNKVLPEWLLVISLVLLLSYTAQNTLEKGIKAYRKETDAMVAAAKTKSLQLSELHSQVQGSEVDEEKEHLLHDAEAAPETRAELRAILERERGTPWDKVRLLILCFIVVLVLNVAKGGGSFHSPLGIECGSLAFWFMTLSVFAWVVGISLYVRQDLMKLHYLKLKLGYKYVKGDIEWDETATIKYPCICFFAGFFAGMFGVGGGIVKGPLMLEMGVDPQVASASSACMILFTSFTATTSFVIFDLMVYDYAFWLFLIGFVFTSIGQYGLQFLMKKYNRNSYIIFSIGAVVGLSAVLMGLQSIISLCGGMRRLIELPWLDEQNSAVRTDTPRKRSWLYSLPPYVRDVVLEEELIIVSNPNSQAIKLKGYRLQQEGGDRSMDFPDDFELGPNEDVYIYCVAPERGKAGRRGSTGETPEAPMGQKKMVWTREKEGSSNKKALLNQDHENITLFDAHNVQIAALEVDGRKKRMHLYALQRLQILHTLRVVNGLLFGRVLLLLLAFFLISTKPDQFVRLEVVSLVFDILARSLDTIRVRDRLYHVLSTLGDRLENAMLLIALAYRYGEDKDVFVSLLVLDLLSSWLDSMHGWLAHKSGMLTSLGETVDRAAKPNEALPFIGKAVELLERLLRANPYLVATVTFGGHMFLLVTLAADVFQVWPLPKWSEILIISLRACAVVNAVARYSNKTAVMEHEETERHGAEEPAMGAQLAMEPSVHSYLGDVEDVARGAILSEGSIVRLPLILLGGVVLFPGETLPLRLYNTDYIRLIRNMLAEAERQDPGSPTSILHLGVLNVKRGQERRVARDPHRRLNDCIGTTAEIRCSAARHAADTSASLMYEGLTLKARGRHRFQFLNDATAGGGAQTGVGSVNGVLFADVRILPESCPPPLSAILPMPRVFRDLAYETDKFQVTHWSVRRVMRHHCAVQLMARAQKVLASMASWSGLCGAAGLNIGAPNPAAFGSEPDSLDLRVAALDPSAFSYRLAANLPLDDEARQDLLSLSSAAERLREEVRILEESAYRPLRCANCQQRLALKSEIFSVPGAEGAVGAYVNPEGFVHQTITLRDVIDEARIHLEGEETLTSTWFPGYAWTIAHCRRCGLHLGWRFTRAVRDVTPQLPRFWGIRRTAVMERGQSVDEEGSSGSTMDSEDEYEDSHQEEEEGESDGADMLEGGDAPGSDSDILEQDEPYWAAMD